VVTEENVEGATIMLRGAIPVVVFDFESARVSAISTSPDASLPPSVSASDIEVSGGSRLLGFVVEPGPPSSDVRAKRPPLLLQHPDIHLEVEQHEPDVRLASSAYTKFNMNSKSTRTLATGRAPMLGPSQIKTDDNFEKSDMWMNERVW
jgi:hypothetical protein